MLFFEEFGGIVPEVLPNVARHECETGNLRRGRQQPPKRCIPVYPAAWCSTNEQVFIQRRRADHRDVLHHTRDTITETLIRLRRDWLNSSEKAVSDGAAYRSASRAES